MLSLSTNFQYFRQQIDSTLMVSLRNNLLKKYAGDEAVDEYSQAWNYVFIEVLF